VSARTRWTIAQGSTGESGVAVTIVLAGLISGSRARWYDVEQPPAFGGSDFAAPVAEEPVVTDTLQSARQHVKQEAADELRCVEPHHALCGFMAVALTALIIFTRLAQESKQVWKIREREGCEAFPRRASTK
jgi:hypothetical protein